jgi:hypothetical protein
VLELEAASQMLHFVNPFSLITYVWKYFDKKHDQLTEAKAIFRRAVLVQLRGLYPAPWRWPKGTGIEPRLKRVFPELQRAVAEFRPHVPESDTPAFDESWLNYHTPTKRDFDESYVHYMSMTGESVTPLGRFKHKNDGKATFKRNVDRLLSFAAKT